MATVLCVDVGSTFTKAVLVDGDSGQVLGSADHPTTVATDVMDGVDAVRDALEAHGLPDDVLVCSSAGGGLRLAVVGHERQVTAEAGYRVGLSAGAKVVHVGHGELGGAGLRELRATAPDVVLLVGGTDGGNAEVLLHNARRLARARIRPPVVVAGNAEAAPAAAAELAATGRAHIVAPNVLPRIGAVAAEGARAAIREVFLAHVIGGKRLSRGRGFADLVRAPTPDAVLGGVEVLADVLGADVLVVDVGGATTDVYSVLTPRGEDAELRRDVVGALRHARTVEADLGMRWGAPGVVDAAAREHLDLAAGAADYAALVATDPGHLAGAAEWSHEEALATAAVLVALRRHGRPPSPSEPPRQLGEVSVLVGSGGVLRHAPGGLGGRVLTAALSDHGGGWRVPDRARTVVDRTYVLFAVGLLARDHPAAARALAAELVAAGGDVGSDA